MDFVHLQYLQTTKINHINENRLSLEIHYDSNYKKCFFVYPFATLTSHPHPHHSLPHESRKYVVSRIREGCAPLFVVCKRGNLEIAEFLITECTADIEQRGLFENPEDSTVHHVTPLWCCSVLSKLPIVRYLVCAGADINAVSDSGSTSVRSSCFMTNMVQTLI